MREVASTETPKDSMKLTNAVLATNLDSLGSPCKFTLPNHGLQEPRELTRSMGYIIGIGKNFSRRYGQVRIHRASGEAFFSSDGHHAILHLN